MKKMPIFLRILLPSVLALLLLPAAAGGIFHAAAERQAVRDAERELEELQSQTLLLVETYLEKSAPQVRRFLRAVSQQQRQSESSARLLLFAAEGALVYPYEEEDRAAVESLADAARGLDASSSESLRLEAAGTAYLARVSAVPLRSQQLEYAVAYCPVSAIGGWVDDAAMIVLAVAFGIAGILTAISVWTARSITRPIQRLCAAADRISAQDFTPIPAGFSLKEPEALRLSMNAMAERLQKADIAQKTFFQGISHELRTPLTSISGYAQGIEQGVLSDNARAARVILEESQRLTEMVNELLTLSRLEQQQAPPLSPIPAARAAGAAVERVQGLALQKNAALRLEAGEDGLSLLGDEKLLAAILANLLSNAVRHAHSEVVLRVEKKGGSVRFSVLDDGDGIAPEDMPHLFERCYKGRNGHFGIGLTIAATAAQKCGGQITAANRPEGGAAFTAEFQRTG